MENNIEIEEMQSEENMPDDNLLIHETMDDLKEVIPSLNLNVPPTTAMQPIPEEKENIISDDALLGIYQEVLNGIREDRQEIDKLLANFVEMVINEGDSTSASKEALVNLVKIKTDTSDKMAKIADLMTRVKLKERDTFPKYLAAHQNNTINIGENATNKRELIKQIERAKKAKEKK
jgi:hypothetical protein